MRIAVASDAARAVQEPSRRGFAPQVIEGEDAPGDGSGRDAEYGFGRTEMQAHSDGPLSGADEFATDLLLSAHRVEVKAISGRGSEAGDNLDLGARNGDQ